MFRKVAKFILVVLLWLEQICHWINIFQTWPMFNKVTNEDVVFIASLILAIISTFCITSLITWLFDTDDKIENKQAIKTLNMNSTVRIKLTKLGVERLRKKHKELQKDYPSSIGNFEPPLVDKDGYSEMQLWVVMNTFGDLLNNGLIDMPFEMNIRIDDSEL